MTQVRKGKYMFTVKMYPNAIALTCTPSPGKTHPITVDFGHGIVGPADAAMKSGDAGDVDNTAVLRRVAGIGFNTLKQRDGADETEGRADVDLHGDALMMSHASSGIVCIVICDYKS